MRLFDKLFGRERPPGWSPFNDVRDHRAFCEAVGAQFARRGVSFDWDDDGETIRPSGDLDGSVLGLSNLALTCRSLPGSAWEKAIASHFERLWQAQRDQLALEASLHDLDSVRPLLRTRLAPDDLVRSGPPCVHEAIAPDLHLQILIDLPTSMRAVGADDLQRWGIGAPEAFEIGLANVAEEHVGEPQSMNAGGASFHVIESGSPYAATQALFLARRAPSEHGWLVGVPTCYLLAYHALVHAGSAINIVNTLAAMLPQRHEAGPHPLSPTLYWVRDRTFVAIPTYRIGSKLHVVPPPEFVALLERLSESRRDQAPPA
jgi:hypothetical protein